MVMLRERRLFFLDWYGEAKMRNASAVLAWVWRITNISKARIPASEYDWVVSRWHCSDFVAGACNARELACRWVQRKHSPQNNYSYELDYCLPNKTLYIELWIVYLLSDYISSDQRGFEFYVKRSTLRLRAQWVLGWCVCMKPRFLQLHNLGSYESVKILSVVILGSNYRARCCWNVPLYNK